MADVASPPDTPASSTSETLRGWMLVILTAVFVALYTAALLGWIKPLPDNQVVVRLESIVAVIIGYYFGRVPGEKNEKTLKQQVEREARKAGEAEEDRKDAQRGEAAAHVDRAALEQKVKSAKAALAAVGVPQGAQGRLAPNLGGEAEAPATDSAARHAAAAALRVLDA
jgi:hypothetical protein